MNYAEIKYNDIANGPGVRTSIFVSGCTHHCKGCFNEIAWDFNYGTPFTDATISDIINSMKPDYIAGLTLLGGEPFEPANQRGLIPLLKAVKENYPAKDIWCFTGYLFDEDIMDKMYYYTCDKEVGCRHSHMDPNSPYTPTADEAVFMLVSFSSAINYLTKKRQ